METIANRLGISRSTVSRLVASVRDEGLACISLHIPEEPRDSLSRRIEDLYDVDVTMVQAPGATTGIRRLERVVGVTGNLIGDAIEDKMMVSTAWGTTVSTISERLMPRRMSGVMIVQLSGAANPTAMGLSYMGEILGNFTRAFGAKALLSPVPVFFDYAEARDLMWRERSIQVVRDIGCNADVTVFGVGSFTSPPPLHVYVGGYLSPEEVTELRRDGVVDDVCTALLHADGTYEDIEINTRATELTPVGLARIPRRICAVAGAAKASVLAAVLCSGMVTDLVVDDKCVATLFEVEEGGKAEPDYGAWS